MVQSAVIAMVAAALALGVAAPASACTCGALAVPTDVTASSSSARAIVSWDGTTETVELAIGITSSGGTIGIIFPTPRKATVEPGDPALFQQLDATIAPTERVEDDWWGRSAPRVAAAAPAVAAPLGDIEPKTIRATNRQGLTSWLKKHDLHLAKADREQIAEYAEDGWSLSMIDLDAPVKGELEPVRLSFETEKPVLPIRLASTSAGVSTLRVAVVGEHRAMLRQDGARVTDLDAAQSVVWSGPVGASALSQLGSYLTVTDVRFDDTADQVRGDIRFIDAPADDLVVPTAVRLSPVTLFGLPLGWVLVVWGAAGVLLGAVFVFVRLRSH